MMCEAIGGLVLCPMHVHCCIAASESRSLQEVPNREPPALVFRAAGL